MDTVIGLYRQGCTLQLHQPQRWNQALWRLIAAMEKQLGCLVGANAYITPAGVLCAILLLGIMCASCRLAPYKRSRMP